MDQKASMREFWELCEQIMTVMLYPESHCGGKKAWNPRQANLDPHREGILSLPHLASM